MKIVYMHSNKNRKDLLYTINASVMKLCQRLAALLYVKETEYGAPY